MDKDDQKFMLDIVRKSMVCAFLLVMNFWMMNYLKSDHTEIERFIQKFQEVLLWMAMLFFILAWCVNHKYEKHVSSDNT